jgi:hypothetical protein
MNRPQVPSTDHESSGGPARGRRGAGRLALLSCLVLVITLHGLALAALVHPAWHGRPGNTSGPGAVHVHVQARVQALPLAAPVRDPDAAAAPTSDTSVAMADTAGAATAAADIALADTAPVNIVEPPPRSERPSAESATGSSTGMAPSLDNASSHAPAIDARPVTQHDATAPEPDSAPYLPRGALSQPARPLADVQINDPGDAPPGDYQATLLLYVDETGQVQQVRLRDGALPPSLYSAAQAGFSAVRFLPGQVQGRPVRSLYPVAVSFSASARAVRNAGAR